MSAPELPRCLCGCGGTNVGDDGVHTPRDVGGDVATLVGAFIGCAFLSAVVWRSYGAEYVVWPLVATLVYAGWSVRVLVRRHSVEDVAE